MFEYHDARSHSKVRGAPYPGLRRLPLMAILNGLLLQRGALGLGQDDGCRDRFTIGVKQRVGFLLRHAQRLHQRSR